MAPESSSSGSHPSNVRRSAQVRGIVVTASTNPVYSASMQKGAGAVGGGAIGAGAIGGSGAAGGGAYGGAARTVTLGVAMPVARHSARAPQLRKLYRGR
eukprot:scaffold13540_cov51-Phaeocystis_antarctica.AAC.1